MCDREIIKAFNLENKGFTLPITSNNIEVVHENTKNYNQFENPSENMFGKPIEYSKGFRREGKLVECIFNPVNKSEKTKSSHEIYAILMLIR